VCRHPALGLGAPVFRLGLQGLWRTIWLLVVTAVIGFALAIPLGLAQAAGPWYLAAPARVFCTVIRGTPLLLQLWLLYYGIGSLFPLFPWIARKLSLALSAAGLALCGAGADAESFRRL
jgi:His/Glu/Gln/Arg/opine family amino acid ABC transporter permease subunit